MNDLRITYKIPSNYNPNYIQWAIIYTIGIITQWAIIYNASSTLYFSLTHQLPQEEPEKRVCMGVVSVGLEGQGTGLGGSERIIRKEINPIQG